MSGPSIAGRDRRRSTAVAYHRRPRLPLRRSHDPDEAVRRSHDPDEAVRRSHGRPDEAGRR